MTPETFITLLMLLIPFAVISIVFISIFKVARNVGTYLNKE